jgi:hypothetical protein
MRAFAHDARGEHTRFTAGSQRVRRLTQNLHESIGGQRRPRALEAKIETLMTGVLST